LGLVMDGTGLGLDGHIWGSEFILARGAEFKRMAHLEYFPLPGGERAVKYPWRQALSMLIHHGVEQKLWPPGLLKAAPKIEVEAVTRMLAAKINSPLTAGLGRYFDVVAALIGFYRQVSYEGEAACWLEYMAGSDLTESGEKYRLGWDEKGRKIISSREMVNGIIKDLYNGVSQQKIACRFHRTLVHGLVEIVEEISTQRGHKFPVALTGGAFQNRHLLYGVYNRLEKRGYKVLINRQVPANDGGVALGQLYVARAIKQHDNIRGKF